MSKYPIDEVVPVKIQAGEMVFAGDVRRPVVFAVIRTLFQQNSEVIFDSLQFVASCASSLHHAEHFDPMDPFKMSWMLGALLEATIQVSFDDDLLWEDEGRQKVDDILALAVKECEEGRDNDTYTRTQHDREE